MLFNYLNDIIRISRLFMDLQRLTVLMPYIQYKHTSTHLSQIGLESSKTQLQLPVEVQSAYGANYSRFY